MTYLEKPIEALPLPKNEQEQYDVLSLFELIEHVTPPATSLASCLPFVKPGGWLVLRIIARTWTSWLTTKVMAEDIVPLVPRRPGMGEVHKRRGIQDLVSSPARLGKRRWSESYGGGVCARVQLENNTWVRKMEKLLFWSENGFIKSPDCYW